jgi:hypothetical protein
MDHPGAAAPDTAVSDNPVDRRRQGARRRWRRRFVAQDRGHRFGAGLAEQVDCELRFHGESYGWECQCLHEGELAYGQRFILRELALAEADAQRVRLLREGWTVPVKNHASVLRMRVVGSRCSARTIEATVDSPSGSDRVASH